MKKTQREHLRMRTQSRRREHRHGAMLPLIAVLLPAVIVFLGFAVDLAYMQNARLELRATTDAAARAAAIKLATTDNPTAARNTAKEIARLNLVAGKPLELRSQDIQVGRSERGANGRFTFVVNKKPSNSVRVTGDRSGDSKGGSVSLFFGSLLGVAGFEPQSVSVASFSDIDICLVLDASTSMKLTLAADDHTMHDSDPRQCDTPRDDSRWHKLDDAVRLFLSIFDETAAKEHVALVTYSSDGRDRFSCGAESNPSVLRQGLTPDLEFVRESMDDMLQTVWNGHTHIEAGIRTGKEVLTGPDARSSSDKVLIVLTDGQENRGSAMNAADECAVAGIRVNTVTFGEGADQDLMRRVADRTGGRHLHADTGQELREAFRELAAITSQLTN